MRYIINNLLTPKGKYSQIGRGVRFGKNVKIGTWARVGSNVAIGNGSVVGVLNSCHLI